MTDDAERKRASGAAAHGGLGNRRTEVRLDTAGRGDGPGGGPGSRGKSLGIAGWLPHLGLGVLLALVAGSAAARREPVATWRARLASQDAELRLEALQRLALRGELPDAGPALFRAFLQDPDPRVRELAVTAIFAKYSKRAQVRWLQGLAPGPERVRAFVFATHLEGVEPFLAERDLEAYFASLGR